MKKVYIAGPLFTFAEQAFNRKIASLVKYIPGLEPILPQELCEGLKDTKKIFVNCMESVDEAHIVVAILDGADADSGTCWEVGYAYAKGKHIIGVRTDFRQSGDSGGFNAMLLHSVTERIIERPQMGFEDQLVQALSRWSQKYNRPELKPVIFKGGKF